MLIHCSMVVKTSDLSVWCLSLHWNEFKSHLIRSGNFVCVCFCLFLLGGGIFCTSPDVLNTHYTGCNCLIVSPFWAKSGKYYFEGISGKLMQLWKERAVIVLGFIWSGEAATASNLREYTIMGHIKILGKLIIIFMIMFWWHIGI